MLRKIINRIKVKSKLFNKLNSWKNRSRTKVVEDLSIRRRKYSIFNFEEISEFIPSNYRFIVPENNLYGHGYQLQKFFRTLDLTNCGIEHGFIFGSLVQDFHLNSWTENIITFSDYRKEFIENQTNKGVICVGPYIHYADYLLSDLELEDVKSKLGKVLLVIPQHSISGVNYGYSEQQIIDYIVPLSGEYDRVIICLYWHDIKMGKHQIYTNNNFEIVNAGHINDVFFLDRLKTILYLSDSVLTNSIGTHIGYSIFMKKPVHIFEQNIIRSVDEKNKVEDTQRDSLANRTFKEINDRFMELFSHGALDVITDEQYRFVADVFGFKYAKRKK